MLDATPPRHRLFHPRSPECGLLAVAAGERVDDGEQQEPSWGDAHEDAEEHGRRGGRAAPAGALTVLERAPRTAGPAAATTETARATPVIGPATAAMIAAVSPAATSRSPLSTARPSLSADRPCRTSRSVAEGHADVPVDRGQHHVEGLRVQFDGPRALFDTEVDLDEILPVAGAERPPGAPRA